MAKCQALADWDGYAARRAQSEAAGKYRGRSITGITDVPMPATPGRVWRTIRSRDRG
jgi:hypothetical protein